MLKEIKSEKDVITNVDLFNEIVNVVKESGKWPKNIISYATSCASTVLIYNHNFSPIFNINKEPGGEYYLDFDIQGEYGLRGENDTVQLGSIKMLYISNEDDIRQMAALYGECIIAYRKIMRDNFDAFNRTGYDTYFLNEKHARLEMWDLTVSSIEDAFYRYTKFHKVDPKKYCTMRVRNNLTREEYRLAEWYRLDETE